MPSRLFAALMLIAMCCAVAPAADAPKGLKDISFDDLKFDIKPATRCDLATVPESIKNLNGQPIRIRGVMNPSFQQKGIKTFILLMNAECQFGSTKDPVWCNVRVTMDEDETASFTLRPVTVEGRLKLEVLEGPDYDLSVYIMDGAKVTK